VQLEPGDYRATCEYLGEPSQSRGGNFTVGRTFGSQDFDEFAGPLFGFLGVVALCGLLFITGIVLLIVGLIRGSRSRRQPPGPYGGQPYPQTPYGQAPYPQGPYPQAPYPQGPYGQPPYGQPPVVPTPGPTPGQTPEPWTGPPPGPWPPAPPQPTQPSPPQQAPPAGPDGGWPGPPN
jgi:hypothetical protein